MQNLRRVRQPGIPNRPYSLCEVETAVRMSVAGSSAGDIAQTLGRSRESVLDKLRRLGLRQVFHNGQTRPLNLLVGKAAAQAVEAEADRRDVSSRDLAATLITIIARDGLFAALLDG